MSPPCCDASPRHAVLCLTLNSLQHCWQLSVLRREGSCVWMWKQGKPARRQTLEFHAAHSARTRTPRSRSPHTAHCTCTAQQNLHTAPLCRVPRNLPTDTLAVLSLQSRPLTVSTQLSTVRSRACVCRHFCRNSSHSSPRTMLTGWQRCGGRTRRGHARDGR